MAFHAEDPLRCPCILEVFYFLLAISTFEASGAKCLVTCKDCEIFNLVAACTAAIRAIVAYQRAIAEQEKVCIRVEESSAGIAAEAVNMPSIAS